MDGDSLTGVLFWGFFLLLFVFFISLPSRSFLGQTVALKEASKRGLYVFYKAPLFLSGKMEG